MWESWRSNNAEFLSIENDDPVVIVPSVSLPSISPVSTPLSKTCSSPCSTEVMKRLHSLLNASVSFRDVKLTTQEDTSLCRSSGGSLKERFNALDFSSLTTGVQKDKLVIILVGLPGRGKTFVCNKLLCYLNWLGHVTRHFNVGNYRRGLAEKGQNQHADFFSRENQAGQEARQRAFQDAFEDLLAWLAAGEGQVALFDATNSSEARRTVLRDALHGRHQYLFIENICTDPVVLEQNVRNKMKYSLDYRGVDLEQAMTDFKLRIAKYEEVYEPITKREYHYIKLIDIVTGRGYMDVNRISGYIPGKIVFFLMQVCKAGLFGTRRIWLTRHGESRFNREGRIGGDSGLSAEGEAYARALPELIEARVPKDATVPVAVWTSTLRRTHETARHLPFAKLRWKALDEINAGVCDGLTAAEFRSKFPREEKARVRDKLKYRYPSGESYLDVIQRLEPAVTELERSRECVCVVAHKAILRALYGYFMTIRQDLIPCIDIPLHTIIELTPMPDGTMLEQRITFSPGSTPSVTPSPETSVAAAAAAAILSTAAPTAPVALSPQRTQSRDPEAVADATLPCLELNPYPDPRLQSQSLSKQSGWATVAAEATRPVSAFCGASACPPTDTASSSSTFSFLSNKQETLREIQVTGESSVSSSVSLPSPDPSSSAAATASSHPSLTGTDSAVSRDGEYSDLISSSASSCVDEDSAVVSHQGDVLQWARPAVKEGEERGYLERVGGPCVLVNESSTCAAGVLSPPVEDHAGCIMEGKQIRKDGACVLSSDVSIDYGSSHVSNAHLDGGSGGGSGGITGFGGGGPRLRPSGEDRRRNCVEVNAVQISSIYLSG